MTQDFNDITTIPVSRLSANQSYSFSLKLSDEARTEMAKTLDLLALKKPSLIGTLKPHGADDWLLEARLGATVQQACVVTLAPVTARIEERVERLFRAGPCLDFDDLEEDAEVEMPEDDRAEPLENTINLAAVFQRGACRWPCRPIRAPKGASLSKALSLHRSEGISAAHRRRHQAVSPALPP